jgi:hypothetical protein
MADTAKALRGMTRSPASVFVEALRTVSVRSIKLTSLHRKPLVLHIYIVHISATNNPVFRRTEDEGQQRLVRNAPSVTCPKTYEYQPKAFLLLWRTFISRFHVLEGILGSINYWAGISKIQINSTCLYQTSEMGSIPYRPLQKSC